MGLPLYIAQYSPNTGLYTRIAGLDMGPYRAQIGLFRPYLGPIWALSWARTMGPPVIYGYIRASDRALDRGPDP